MLASISTMRAATTGTAGAARAMYLHASEDCRAMGRIRRRAATIVYVCMCTGAHQDQRVAPRPRRRRADAGAVSWVRAGCWPAGLTTGSGRGQGQGAAEWRPFIVRGGAAHSSALCCSLTISTMRLLNAPHPSEYDTLPS